ncbi:MAG TPA: response regulator [Patescibacteria group bacterium]|nr:response regulator [Patescibacteria group bacterium]
MAKVMLVEDDNNLREIYQARLLADGYEIVSAQDGEEALAMAVKEKPDLIIADIMMPKISGFDMLDILRSTPETKDTKVMMMTALSQAEDKARATKLGADRYLVKSQVTLEDVARTAREVLEGVTSSTPPSPATTQDSATVTTPTIPNNSNEPTTSVKAPLTASIPVTSAPGDVSSTAPGATITPNGLSEPLKQEEATVQSQINDFAHVQDPPTPDPTIFTPDTGTSTDAITPAPVADPATSDGIPDLSKNKKRSVSVSTESNSATGAQPEEPKTAVHTKVIAPINDINAAGPSLEALVAKEEAKEAAMNPAAPEVMVGDVSKKDKKDDTPPVDPNSISL